jgi:RNA polymerase-binding transcription factor DksA
MPNSKPAKPAAKANKPAPEKASKSENPAAAKAGKSAKVNGDGEKKHESASEAKHEGHGGAVNGAPDKPVKMTPFLLKQKDRLLQLRDSLLDAMAGVAKDNLRSRAEGSEASAFGMHQADAGSDAYDRDFALSLLSQEQDALYEIEEALKRVEAGTYGVCEMSGKAISQPRLEALPFARYTVECQSQLEKQNKVSRTRVPVTSLFGLTDEEGGDSDEEESTTESKEEKE